MHLPQIPERVKCDTGIAAHGAFQRTLKLANKQILYDGVFHLCVPFPCPIGDRVVGHSVVNLKLLSLNASVCSIMQRV